ncbi:hypothetical protein PFISCL1PPCAC_4196 [Pristionchus fissidentatus]|uniref:7TM GPCR serpentine receptor class x (Srx) domain-containing protein n=1 Tax=Pristionchus fissidentatus TaxID=1538716 RepID=A0AAV5V2W0_9BILA|nr:hypothetical protein PFISCL1PPCAC_4196 [Pristionchus fissidentatus]
MDAITIACDAIMVITLPLLARILFVLAFSHRKLNLDPSFHTLMINACTMNLIYSIVFIFIQEPASAGLLLYFYKQVQVGHYFILKMEFKIQSTILITLGAVFHVILGATRLTAIALPVKHEKIWSSRRLIYVYISLWVVLVLASIPLVIPGSTAIVMNPNVYGTMGMEFALLGNYFTIYSLGCTVFGVIIQLLNFLCYVCLGLKFRNFLKLGSGAKDIRKMTRGVIRTTVSAFFISSGSWLLGVFIIYVFGNIYGAGKSPFTKLQFSVYFR